MVGGTGLLAFVFPLTCPSPLAPGNRGPWLPCAVPQQWHLGWGCAFGSGFVPLQHPMSSLLSPAWGSLSPAPGFLSWLVPSSLRAA